MHFKCEDDYGLNLFQKKYNFKEKTYGTSFLRRIKPESTKEKAFGCILGAFCGDACGAHYHGNPQVLSN